ncbi:hypothetical protein [Fictibacillus terranigra]|uniref:Uncharacterized protein n=1 Tax=Fictibacillus terranigra TaxID=3058424 RepID=A0ABT8EDP9_9BACL|nr:hypothetical protein [Fictibacillus sp. CENA-BCM004]MDN4075937.1 hypothetical protein [Fictibacillus sp. CENA-BCM004]
MKREYLIAPEYYNFTEEAEKFAHKDNRIAIIWLNELGDPLEIVY